MLLGPSDDGPSVRVVAANHAAEGLEHRLETERAIENGEDAFPQGVAQAALTLASAGLGGPQEDDRRGRLDPPEELRTVAGGPPSLGSIGISRSTRAMWTAPG